MKEDLNIGTNGREEIKMKKIFLKMLLTTGNKMKSFNDFKIMALFCITLCTFVFAFYENAGAYHINFTSLESNMQDGDYYYIKRSGSLDYEPNGEKKLGESSINTGYYKDVDIFDGWNYRIAIARPGSWWKPFSKDKRISNWVLINEPPVYGETVVINISSPLISDNIDDDDDGLTLSWENEYGTNPDDPDTDDDNLKDGIDVNGIDIDITLDGQSTFIINTAATDPLNPDTDGDGVLDGNEVYGWSVNNWITDPCNPDTDGDGVIDGQDPNPLGIVDANGDGVADEWVSFWQSQITQWGFPSEWIASLADPDADTDDDGINNRTEYENGGVPIVAPGHYETRILPSPVVIEANVNETITVTFNIVDLSFEPSIGEVFQMSQPWAGEIRAVPENLSIKYLSPDDWYRDDLPARFQSRFGIFNEFEFNVDTANLADNTTYKESIVVNVGGVINECEVQLLIGDNPGNNHAPHGLSLLTPTHGAMLMDVDDVQLAWEAATDEDAGDTVSYEVRCSAYHIGEMPEVMISDIQETNVKAIGWEDGLTDRLAYETTYKWQVVACDNHGAVAYSPVWSFTMLPSSYTYPTILSSELRTGYVDNTYREQPRVAHGLPPYEWCVVSGSLPPGLSLRADGVVHGTPTTTGAYNFELEVEDCVGGTANALISLGIETSGPGPSGVIGHGAAGHGSF